MTLIDLIAAIATSGGGVFSTAQARAHGIDDKQLRAQVRAGQLVRLTRGWYAPAVGMRGGEEHRHRLRTRAVTSLFGTDHVATHHSALLMYALPVLTPDLRVVHIGSPTASRTVRTDGYVRHQLPEGTRIGATTPAAVSPEVAAVQVGLLESPRAALVAADQALRRGRTDLLGGPVEFGHCSPDDLHAALAVYTRVPGICPVRSILQLADPTAESPGESLLRHDLHLLAVPVEPQFVIQVGDHSYRADFRVKGTRMLIEFDGLIKLDDPLEARRADERERALRRQGWVIVRFTWSELGKLDLIARRLAQAAAAEKIPWPVRA